MKKLNFVAKQGHLLPFDDDAENYVNKLKDESLIVASVSQPRNYKMLQRYFSLLADVISNTDTILDVSRLHEVLKDNIGLTRCFYFDGKVYKENGSISFEKMDELEFKDHFSKVKDELLAMIPIHNYTLANKIVGS